MVALASHCLTQCRCPSFAERYRDSVRKAPAPSSPRTASFSRTQGRWRTRHARHFRTATRASANPGDGGGFLGWLGRAQASIPVVGLLQRLTSDEGGVGSDRLYYAEYCVRQERAQSRELREALMDFHAQYGQMARPGVVMFWCWVATVAVGVVRSEDVLLAARRMRASLDMEYELNGIDTLLDDPDKRAIAARAAATVGTEARVKVAADAISACCVGPGVQVDEDLLKRILGGFFPGAQLDDLFGTSNG